MKNLTQIAREQKVTPRVIARRLDEAGSLGQLQMSDRLENELDGALRGGRKSRSDTRLLIARAAMRGISQQDIATHCNMSKSAISHYANGKRRMADKVYNAISSLIAKH